MEKIRGFFKIFKNKTKQNRELFNELLESKDEYNERMLSIRTIYFTMFLMALGFSIILTGVWPYLDKLDHNAGKEFMGYVVAANPLGQLIFSPIFGWWSNRLKSIRIPMLSSMIMFIVANSIYSTLEVFPRDQRKFWMLGSRFLVGISSANVAVCRSYLASATTNKERTKVISILSLTQVLGFVVGPALQTLVVPLGEQGYTIIRGYFEINMYTSTGWINVAMCVLNFFLFLPMFFKEHRIAAKEAMVKQSAKSEKAAWKAIKPDYFAAWMLIVTFFVMLFNFMLLETLGTLLTMDQFAWNKSEAIYYMGILMCAGAFIACFSFIAIQPLCKLFSEPNAMIWCGFLLMTVGRLVYIPWNGPLPKIYDDSLEFLNDTNLNSTLNGNSTNFENLDRLGCPKSQEWCTYTPAITLFQFVFGYLITSIGYPIGVTLIQTIFTKVLGPRPQGIWMGMITGAGSLSRVCGPIFVSYVYTRYGTKWAFSLTTLMMAICQIVLLIFKCRLTPVDGRQLRNNNHHDCLLKNEIKVEIQKC